MREHRYLSGRMRGVAAVEFAIVLIPLVILVSGVAEYGRAIYQYDALTKSTRSAARYLSQFSPEDLAYPVDEAKCLAVYGNVSCTGSALVSGLNPSMVTVCDRLHTSDCSDAIYGTVSTYDNSSGTGAAAGTISLVAVKISGFQYSPLQSFINASGITFSNIVTVMRQVL